jgi:thiamine-phosphate pyrophosphorylase
LPVLDRAITRGVDLIQIREKDLPARELEEMTRGAVRLARRSGTARVLVNDRLDVALACGAAGVHLPANGFLPHSVKRICPAGFLVGVSTHSKLEAKAAVESGADFIVFGPVFSTPSKPGGRAVGIEALADAVTDIEIPIFALGGIGPDNVKAVARAGAAGVAGISAFMDEESLKKLMEAIRGIGI